MRISEPNRRILARLTSSLLCACAIVALWTQDWPSGSFNFLALTYYQLAFPPGPSLGPYIESSVINIAAQFASIVLSNVGISCAIVATRKYGVGSTASRAIPFTFLLIIVAAAGAIKSAYPRLTMAARMASFTAVFLLTSQLERTQFSHETWTDFLVVLAIPTATSLFATLVFVRQSSKSYPNLIIQSLTQLRKQLDVNLHAAFREPSDASASPKGNTLALQSIKASNLRRAYTETSLEPTYSRLHVKEMHPFSDIVERLRGELIWGATIPIKLKSNSPSYLYNAFKEPTSIICSSLDSSIRIMEDMIAYAYETSPKSSEIRHIDASTIGKSKQGLQDATRILKLQLGTIQGTLDDEAQDWSESGMADNSASRDPAQREVFVLSLFSISLLQMAADVQAALNLGLRILEKLEARPKRKLRLSQFSRAWFNSTTQASTWGDTSIEDEADLELEQSTDPSRAEQEQGLLEQEHHSSPLYPTTNAFGLSHVRSPRDLLHWLGNLWSNPQVMERRIQASQLFRNLRHSPHSRYALKNVLGVGLLSLPAYLPFGSAGSRWFESFHGAWIVISYIFVLEVNTGATIRTGGLRIIGTILGALLAYLAWVTSRGNPYALPVMITVVEFPISYFIERTSLQPIGVVAGLTLAPILWTNEYRHVETPVIRLAVNRGYAIAIGIVAAVLMNHFIFPRHCRLIFLSQTSKIYGKFTELYISLTKRTIRPAYGPSAEYRRNIELEEVIRESLARANTLIDMMHLEISILPKPLKLYRSTIYTLERGLDLFIGLRRVRENIPKKETVAQIFKYRKDLISSICISLFACETAWGRREAIPQFLPSARHALGVLVGQKAEALLTSSPPSNDIPDDITSPDTTPSTPLPPQPRLVTHFLPDSKPSPAVSISPSRPCTRSLSIMYSLAENALLEEIVTLLEETLEISRKLHGTTAWALASSEDEMEMGSFSRYGENSLRGRRGRPLESSRGMHGGRGTSKSVSVSRKNSWEVNGAWTRPATPVETTAATPVARTPAASLRGRSLDAGNHAPDSKAL